MAFSRKTKTQSFRKSASTQRPLLQTLEPRLLLSVGGGFTGAGILGAYYANPTLAGTPVLSRQDVRVDFNWNTNANVAGTSTYNLPATNFSVDWSGQLKANYSENYTFKTSTDGGVLLKLRPTGSPTWTTVINDYTQHTLVDDAGAYALTAGQSYDVDMTYFEGAGAAVARLKWSSPSTPTEVIEPATPTGINAATAVDYDPGMMFADAMKMARIGAGSFTPLSPGATLDANGWLTGDGQFILFHGQNSAVTGKYTMTFTGQATVGYNWSSVTVNSQSYDAASNTTTTVFTLNNQGPLQLSFTNTKRLATDLTPTGITDIKIMRPSAPGATTSFAPNVLFTPAYETLLSNFTAIRFMDYLATNSAAGQTGGNAVVNWADRTKPWYSSQQGVGGGYDGAGGALEYALALCNETGKDLWLNVPMQASDSYLNNLALAVKYGTDANGNPYATAQTNPVYAPLNSNLKVYLEYSNEVWNGSFYQASLANSMAQTEITNNTANGQILKYDNNTNAWILGQRWWILRTKEISDAFRTVWGDAAMMTTVRPVFQFQYNNANGTAANNLQFLDNYFNNADGNHVVTPHPVNYYLYGAGGGWYNSVNDSSGLGGVNIGNSSFEIPALAASSSQANPAGATWTFTGTTGIVSNNTNRAAAALTTTLGTLTTPTSTLGVGYAFTVGAQDIYVNELGRYVVSGNVNAHNVYLLDSTHAQLAVASVSTAGKTAGQYAYTSIGAVHLLAGQTYYIVSVEDTYSWNPTHDSYYDQGSSETTYAGMTINNALTINMPNMEWDHASWVWNTGAVGHVVGPVDFRYATAPGAGPVAYPPDASDGAQAAYIQGAGSISQTLTFPAGVSGVTFYAAEGAGGGESFNVYIDGVQLNRDWRPEFTPDANGYGFYRTGTDVNLTAGAHTLSFQGAGAGVVFIDAVKVESADRMLASGLADISAMVRTEVSWAQAYGLRTVGYEGGFDIGGDQPTAVAYAANVDPRVKQDVIDTMNQYLAAGGNLPIVFNATGGAYAMTMTAPYGTVDINAQNTPKMQGYNQVLAGLPTAATNGTTVPMILNSSNVTLAYGNSYDGLLYADTALNIYRQGGWVSWNANVPVNGTYTLTTSATGAGGAYAVEVDGQTLVTGAAGTDSAGQITLTAGLHSVRVRSTAAATFQVSQVVFAQNGAPAAPTLNSAVGGDAAATLTWTAVTGATGYKVRYGTASGAYPNAVDAGNTTSYTAIGLTTNQQYFFAVDAYNASGESLPSNEKGVLPLAPGQTGTLLFWNFTGAGAPAATTGAASSVASTANTGAIQGSVINAGAGMSIGSLSAYQGRGAMNSNRGGGWAAADLAAATTNNDYFQWTATPTSGYQMSLSSLDLVTYQQNSHPAATVVVEYSLDGFATAGTSVGTINPVNSGWYGTATNLSLAGFANLQNVTATVTFRAYGYGFGNYEDKGLGQIPGNNTDVDIIGSFLPIQTNTLLSWDFTGAGAPAATTGAASSVASTANTGAMQASVINAGTGMSIAPLQWYQGRGAMNDQGGGGGGWSASDLTTAHVNNDYFQWTATPTSGYQMSLSSLDLVTYQQNSHPAATVVVEYSLDGFATAGTSVGTINPVNSGWTGTNTNLSLAGFANLQNATATVTFRAYGYGFGAWEDKGLGQIPGNNTDVDIIGSFLPTPPTNLTASAVSTQINLSWTAPARTVTGYYVYRGTTPGGESATPLNATPLTTITYSDTAVSPGTTYYYTVKAISYDGASAASIEANAATPVSNAYLAATDVSTWGAPVATRQWAGFQFTVNGTANLTLTQVGLYNLGGSAAHTLKLYDVTTGTFVLTTPPSINLATGAVDTYDWASVGAGVTLIAGHSYYLLADFTASDSYAGLTTVQNVDSHITINGAVTTQNWTTFTVGAIANQMYGPLNLLFTL